MYVDPTAKSQSFPFSGAGEFNSSTFSEFSVGTVLSLSFSAFFKHPFVFLGLCFVAQIPGLVVAAVTQNATGGWVSWIISFVLWMVIQGAVAYGVYETLRGKSAQLGNCFSHGMERLINLTAAALLCSIAIVSLLAVGTFGSVLLAQASFFLAPVMAIALAWYLTRFMPVILAVLIGIVFLFLGGAFVVLIVIPLLFIITAWLLCKWSMIAPVCVVERLDPIECLSRSTELTEEHRWAIAALYAISFTIGGAITFAFGFAAEILTYSPVYLILIERFAAIVPMAFTSVVTAVIYYELRNAKEGISVESLADVFD